MGRESTDMEALGEIHLQMHVVISFGQGNHVCADNHVNSPIDP
jgi:hypothetical protein